MSAPRPQGEPDEVSGRASHPRSRPGPGRGGGPGPPVAGDIGRDSQGRDVDDDATPSRRPQRADLDDARRALRRDVDRRVYARRRRQGDRRRGDLERGAYDPNPGEDDWTVPDRSGRRRMPGTPESLGDLLGSVVEDRGWGDRVRSSVLFARWPEVVGDDVARHCDPIRLVGGVLVVAASSPSWATQLTYLSGQLTRAVNHALGEPLVDRVEVQVRR